MKKILNLLFYDNRETAVRVRLSIEATFCLLYKIDQNLECTELDLKKVSKRVVIFDTSTIQYNSAMLT